MVDLLSKHHNNVGFALIYNNNAYLTHKPLIKDGVVWDYLKKLDDIKFKTYDHPSMGKWVGPFFKKDKPNKLLHGTSSSSNYGMKGYPLFYYNNKYAQLGVSNYHPVAGEIIEITYNHEA